MIEGPPYSAPCRVAIDLSSVTFGLIQDVDLFRVSEEHLANQLKKKNEDQRRKQTIIALTCVLPACTIEPPV